MYRRGDEFGQTVETGDFNGDGYMDLAIGAPGEDSGNDVMDSGKSYDQIPYTSGSGMLTVMYGSATGLSSIGSQTFQIDSSGAFGRSLAAGDFNRDGITDLAAGAGSGIRIFQGTKNGLQDTGVGLGGGSYSLAVGDFNGDGTDDLAGGDPFASNQKGSVSVFYGTANVGLIQSSQYWSQDSAGILGLAEGAPDARFDSEKKGGDRFGFSLTAGDFNGDGKDDLAVGVPGERFYMGGASNVPGGAVNVIYGSQSGLTRVGNQFWDQNGTEGFDAFNLEGGIEANDQFGYDVKAGDFNGDGIADLAIGVPGEDYSTSARVDESNGGAVAIIYGKRFQGLTNVGNQLIDQNTPGMAGGVEKDDRFGESLAVGDFNYDGIADLAIGTPGETKGSKRGGAVSIVLGTSTGINPTLNQLIDQSQITGAKLEDADLFGAALAIGDFDGNGSDDLAIGAPGEGAGSSIFNHAGEVNVVYGGTFLPTIVVSADLTPIREGSSVSSAFTLSSGVREGTLVTLKSVGTAKLGVDFAVSGATVDGDFVTFRMPRPNSNPTTRSFTISALQDTVRDPFERVAFEVVKGNGYMVKPNQRASVSVQDASPLVVDTLADENDGDYTFGDLSLREMIQLSSSGAAIGFASDLQGTITLNSELLINKNLTINGSGTDRISLSGNRTSRVFEIANGMNVTLKGMTIKDGFANNNSGGGIENFGNLTIVESRITNNQALYGGGIHNSGNLTIHNSTIANNTATDDGGGIYIDLGNVNLVATTISDNQAANDGGGIYQVGGSGVLYNTTVSGNQASNGGGIYQAGGSLVLDQTTIANNIATTAGSGIYHYRDLTGGTTRVKSTLIAGNRTFFNNIGDVYGTVVSLGNNLIGNATGSNGFELDQRGSYHNPLDPKLGVLQNNGGPTWTHALLAGSPAINAASVGESPTDQRGTIVQDGRRDIGAFELIPHAVLLPGTPIVGEAPTAPITLPVGEAPIAPITLPILETLLETKALGKNNTIQHS